MAYVFSQIMTAIAFIFLIIILFREESDYLLYSFIALLIAALPTAWEVPGAGELDVYIEAIDWSVIIFLIFMFTIVAILNEAKVFHEIARRIVKRYRKNVRKMFYMICLTSTLSAAIIEDLSVAIIFIPIIIYAAKELNINPTPFLLGMTICINLASTLTPFGSAQNIMIAHYFDLNVWFFIRNFGLYFIFTTFLTLFMLDRLILTKTLKEEWVAACKKDEKNEKLVQVSQEPYLIVPIENPDVKVLKGEKSSFRRNLIGLGIFVVMLLTIHALYLVGLLGVIMFTLLNPVPDREGKKRPNVAYYLAKVDYKLLYFFMCLFILVHLMELNGLINLIEGVLKETRIDNIFWLSVVILLITSLFSGLLDNAPVTIIFLPVINLLIEDLGMEVYVPLIVAFVLGINLGGNFLPQGSAADMMTLELAQKNCVEDLTYKRLVKVGGFYAFLHVFLGILYLAFLIYVV